MDQLRALPEHLHRQIQHHVVIVNQVNILAPMVQPLVHFVLRVSGQSKVLQDVLLVLKNSVAPEIDK